MVKWIDDNHIDGEMDEATFIERVNESMKARTMGGRDGKIVVYEESSCSLGISYKLLVVRYFVADLKPDGTYDVSSKGMNRIGKWVLVEGARPGGGIVDLLGLDELFWHDTLHAWNHDQSLREQWEEAERLALADALRVHDLAAEFTDKVQSLRRQLDEYLGMVLPERWSLRREIRRWFRGLGPLRSAKEKRS